MIIDEVLKFAEGNINNIYQYVAENAPETYTYLVLTFPIADLPPIMIGVAISIKEQSKKIRSLEPSLN